MESPSKPALARFAERRIARRGLRPRVAASIIAVLWLAAVVVFGVVEHFVNKETFGTVWEGMWWATQTVTTVGYGDVVPQDDAGKLIASVLMIGGLSFFAVITGLITSLFVARAQADQRQLELEGLEDRLERIASELATLTQTVAGSEGRHRDPPEPPLSSH
jgi:voltage-gated potassium channel Kch